MSPEVIAALIGAPIALAGILVGAVATVRGNSRVDRCHREHGTRIDAIYLLANSRYAAQTKRIADLTARVAELSGLERDRVVAELAAQAVDEPKDPG